MRRKKTYILNKNFFLKHARGETLFLLFIFLGS